MAAGFSMKEGMQRTMPDQLEGVKIRSHVDS